MCTAGHADIVELLLQRNDVQIDSRDSEGGTPLWYAAESGGSKIVTMLIQRGADANAENESGKAILDNAANHVSFCRAAAHGPFSLSNFTCCGAIILIIKAAYFHNCFRLRLPH